MKNAFLLAAMTVAVMSGAGCQKDEPTGPILLPPNGSDQGIHFTAGTSSFGADGSFNAATSSAVLAQEFAVATADSLGGIVVIAYDENSSGSGNLFVIQAPLQTGTYTCGGGASCHGRYITGVPNNGDTSDADRYFEITSGTLNITSVSSGRAQGTFSGSLLANDQQAGNTMTVTGGTIDVPLIAQGASDGTLACLLSKVGIGSGTCN